MAVRIRDGHTHADVGRPVLERWAHRNRAAATTARTLLTSVVSAMRERVRYSGLGALLSLGAPAGLIALRLSGAGKESRSSLQNSRVRERIRDLIRIDRPVLAYFGASTAVVFAAFGYALGRIIERTAISDSLTGLPNLREFNRRLAEAMARSARYSEPLALLSIDLDHFKEINDEFGHLAGNAMLRSVADALRSAVRTSDLAFRWGGDEFAVIAPNTGYPEALAIAERIRSAVLNGHGHAPVVSLSVGVAVPFRDHDGGRAAIDDLLIRADAAMYAAKPHGSRRLRSAGRAR